jgi:enamine deaminase RidA (YjgF/YER057c/UK114 family)
MAERISVSSGTRFEELFGYSRAVRVGDWVAVAGCTAMTPGGPVGGADITAQTAECLRRIQLALEAVGASLEHVVRTRFYVVDIRGLAEVGRIHREIFKASRPASTIVQVAALADPSLLVEVDADAIIASG